MHILHQAVLAEGKRYCGNLHLYKLLSLGFPVNQVDENGDGALHQLFRASEPVECAIQIFIYFASIKSFDIDSLMRHLGKEFTIFGRKGYGVCMLLQLSK